ncbi:MAG: hypothetical protein RL385_3712 [Pseudomonadota bacterium]
MRERRQQSRTGPRACQDRERAARSLFGAGVMTLAACAWLPGVAFAKPEAPASFCATYPEAPDCDGRIIECSMCHTSTFPAAWNAFGGSLLNALPRGMGFAQGLPLALAAVQDADADGDGVANRAEILGGTQPGDASSFWSEPAQQAAPENPSYAVGSYDVAFAYRRASVLYCGKSPSYEELAPFRAANADQAALRTQLHTRLDACLHGTYWRNEGLKRLADDRIRPAKSAGPESKVLVYNFRLVIGDYDYDYRLWVYALTDDRDARDLLLAQYYVVDDGKGGFALQNETIRKPDPNAFAGGQVLEKDQRAGMITMQWFLVRNTMFSQLPRTSAAAAYRAYLGMDIAKTQGLYPVAGEPDDIDAKGVKEARCASCHSTLDPLAYAFAKYNGISGPPDAFALLLGIADFPFGGFEEGRAKRLMPNWSDSAQQAVVLGKPVQSLRQWAEVAADSDAFARNLAQIFFEHALSRGPNPGEMEEFAALWRGLRADKFSANRLIHHLIDTQAFGAP